MPVRQRTAWRLPGILDVGMNLLHFDQEGWGSVFGAEVSCQLRYYCLSPGISLNPINPLQRFPFLALSCRCFGASCAEGIVRLFILTHSRTSTSRIIRRRVWDTVIWIAQTKTRLCIPTSSREVVPAQPNLLNPCKNVKPTNPGFKTNIECRKGKPTSGPARAMQGHVVEAAARSLGD